MIENSIITDTTFDFDVIKLSIKDANIDKCQFKGKIENTSISEKVTKCLFKGEIENAQISKDLSNCQFEGLFGEESNKIMITGSLNDMVIQQDITPSSAKYVQTINNSSEYIEIASLEISPEVVPRLGKTLHKECFIDTRDGKKVFIVQVPTDDNNPRGTILMFYPGILQEGQTLESVIPEGYAICDGKTDGVPNLSGRFIKAVSDYNNIGEYNTEDGTNSIKIKEENLPNHTHQFTVTNNSSIANHVFDGVRGDYIELTRGSDRIWMAGTTTKTLTHNFDINVTIEQDTNPNNFPNKPINIEPNYYALIFIMKL